MAENDEIRINELPDTESITPAKKLMVLADAANNTLNNITAANFMRSMISSADDNLITQDENGKIYAEAPEIDKTEHLTVLASSGIIQLESNKSYRCSPAGDITFVLPSVINTDINNSITILMNYAAEVSIDFGLGEHPYFFGGEAPILEEGQLCEIIYQYFPDGGKWAAGVLSAEETA